MLMEKFATPEKDFSPIRDLRLTPKLNANSSEFDPVATANAVSMITLLSNISGGESQKGTSSKSILSHGARC